MNGCCKEVLEPSIKLGRMISLLKIVVMIHFFLIFVDLFIIETGFFFLLFIQILVLLIGISSINISPENDEYRLVYTQILDEYIEKKRNGEPVVLAIDTPKVIDDGRDFYRVPKGIWLIERVMPEYLFVVI